MIAETLMSIRITNSIKIESSSQHFFIII